MCFLIFGVIGESALHFSYFSKKGQKGDQIYLLFEPGINHEKK